MGRFSHFAYFLTRTVGDFTSNSIAAFPYMLASQEDQNIFLKDCVPRGFSLNDPDHLNMSQIDALYAHLLARQRKGLPPFVVLNAGPLHAVSMKKSAASSKKSAKGKGKQKMEYEEVNSEEEDVSENVDGPSDGGLDGGASDDDIAAAEESETEIPRAGPQVGTASSSKLAPNPIPRAGPSKPAVSKQTPQKKAASAKQAKAKKAFGLVSLNRKNSFRSANI